MDKRLFCFINKIFSRIVLFIVFLKIILEKKHISIKLMVMWIIYVIVVNRILLRLSLRIFIYRSMILNFFQRNLFFGSKPGLKIINGVALVQTGVCVLGLIRDRCIRVFVHFTTLITNIIIIKK